MLAGTGLALTLVSARRAATSLPPFVTRWAWLAVDLALGPLLLGQLGVYDVAAGLVHHLFGH